MNKAIKFLFLVCICFLGTACGASLVVDSAGDEPDQNLNDGVCKTENNECTLRAAIMEANVSDDISQITFHNVSNINPASALPPITTNNARIDGGGSVVINGQPNGLENESGFEIRDSSNVYIQGLRIKNFFSGIYIHSTDGFAENNMIGTLPSQAGDLAKRNIIINNQIGIIIAGESASKNIISGNHIGVGVDGATPGPNEIAGIQISEGANNNLIGNTSGSGIPAGGNLISGNNGPGIWILNAVQNHVSGNYIGSNLSGTSKVENNEGIRISHGSYQNSIGYDKAGSGSLNLISGNEIFGIVISESNNNFISGNFIGTRINGNQAMPNTHGVWIEQGAGWNIIGTNGDSTNDAAEANLISGNLQNGISIQEGAIANVISGNLIGTRIDGQTGLGNGWAGVITSGDNTQIGTYKYQTSSLAGANVISDSGMDGIVVHSNYNVISGNMIGVDKTGLLNLGNSQNGISVHGNENIIGTNGDGVADAYEKNVISGNGSHGILINGGTSNTVAGNFLGTDVNGTTAIPNGLNAQGGSSAIKLMNGSSNNVIGTNGDGSGDSSERNLISGNLHRGIVIDGSNSNLVAGNYIGTDISGTSALGNSQGIVLTNGSSQNLIGTNADGSSDFYEGNLVCGSIQGAGIQIDGSQNQVAGNYIGTDKSGLVDLGNYANGILITDSSIDNLIGGSNQKANTIAFNYNAGILVYGPGVNNIRILNNSIFSNDFLGIDLASDPQSFMVSPNDPGDLDGGANDMMNYPILSAGSSITGFVSVSGEIVSSLPYTSYHVQFFNNDDCDPTGGHGEGKTYLGSKQVFTDSNGNASFSSIFSGLVFAGDFITSTATAYGKTSEFSNCVEVSSVEDTYSGEVEENPCDQFAQDDMSLVNFYLDPDTGMFSLYVKNPQPFPAVGPAGDWEYTAALGEIPATECGFKGPEDRIYCDFLIPENYFNSKQTLQLFSNYCFPPFYVNEVSIFAKDPAGPGGTNQPEGCYSDLRERACIAAGGIFSYATNKCICP